MRRKDSIYLSKITKNYHFGYLETEKYFKKKKKSHIR